jgi:hypothetical protein
MTNEYVIYRTDQHHPTRHFEFADTAVEAEAQFRKYWCVTAPVEVHLYNANVTRPFAEVKQ